MSEPRGGLLNRGISITFEAEVLRLLPWGFNFFALWSRESIRALLVGITVVRIGTCPRYMIFPVGNHPLLSARVGILIGFICVGLHTQPVGDVGLRKCRSSTARSGWIREGTGMALFIPGVHASNINHIGALWSICLLNGKLGLNEWIIRLVRHRGLCTGVAAGRLGIQQSLEPEQLVMADIGVAVSTRGS
ncbi:hypothetical protein EDC04DRAFT_2682613 [Pisolithus marmoratus]|nr:hypothetical protein EDC04DRAFT_2682613 [Pisolithus marmoratus]